MTLDLEGLDRAFISGAQRLPLLSALMLGVADIRRGIERDVLAAAQTLGIEDLLDRKPGQLSGAQRHLPLHRLHL